LVYYEKQLIINPFNILKIEKKECIEKLLSPNEPSPFVILNPDSVVPLLLVCDHASNRFPQSLGSMGLDYLDRVSHMTLDIGAGAIAESLADKLGATALLCQYSRLVVDCNRELSDNSMFLENSEGTNIPGNQNLQINEKERRVSEIYWPYHNAIEAQICRLRDQYINPIVISIHSFTPVMNGEDREWEMGVLWDKDQITAEFFLNKLTDAGFFVGNNEPYSGKAPEDFTIDYHAEPIGLPHVGIEIRQDLINHDEGVERITDTLQEVISALTTSTRKIDIEKRKSSR
jgi:predicted N-formylglutamate amidohydrolase